MVSQVAQRRRCLGIDFEPKTIIVLDALRAEEREASLTTVAQTPSIVMERATSSYLFRSSELSQPI